MIRILLLDDHPVLRHGVRAVLDTQSDLEVVAEAGSAAEAEAAAAGHDLDVALVDLDLGAGRPDGIEATRTIRRASPRTEVLVFTAYDSDADIVRALDAGAAGYLVKDSRPAEIFQAIRSAASGGTPLTGPIGARLMRRVERPDETLTPRELDVLTRAAAGLSNRDLARELHVSEATVKTHLHHAFTKLGADNRQAAIASAVKRGIIRL
ncbi:MULTISPECIES: response regulator transcription factor [unclassified Microbacterium]|uniref:response regulator transcription factor n=1 Tax=unclassified Microbacterium TaxID=2609290 RepID=UPI003010164D